MERCTKCQAPLEPGTFFCSNCGAPKARPAAAPRRTCPRCGHAMSPNARFCTSCGAREDVPGTPAPVAAPKKKRPLALALSIIAVVLVLALGVSWSFGLFGNEPLIQLADRSGNDTEVRDDEDDEDRGSRDEDDEDRISQDKDDEDEGGQRFEPNKEDEPVTQPPSTNANTVKEYTISVWAPSSSQEEGNDWLTAMEERFAAAHPEYDITWENGSMDEGSAGSMVIYDVTASADVFMFANDQLGALINYGGLTRLGGTFEAQIRSDNTEFMVNSVTHTDGGIYAFPVTTNTWFMYYNKDVFSEEDVRSLDTMLEKGRVHLPMTPGWNAGCFFLGCGGTIFGENGLDASAGIQFGGEAGYTAARKMIELVGHGNVTVGGMDANKLMDGTADAVFSGSWDYSTLKGALGDKLGVAMLPTFTADGQEYQMTAMSGTKCIGVNPNSGTVEGKQRVCVEFAAFLASEEAQLQRYLMCGVIPAHASLRWNEAVASDPVAVAELDTCNYASVLQSALPEMSNYWTPVETFSKNVVSGDINLYNYEIAVDQMMDQLNYGGL